MSELLKVFLSLLQSKFGSVGLLLLALSALGIYAWYQHNKAKILEHRIEFEVERRKAATEDMLQVREDLKRHDKAPDSDTSPSNAGKVRILIVDDVEILVDSLKEFLLNKIEGAEIETALDGDEALEKTDKFHPHVTLLDLLMPKMTGWEVLAELSRKGIRQPVLIYTGYVFNPANAPIDISTLPHVEVLFKPSTGDELAEAIKKHLASVKF